MGSRVTCHPREERLDFWREADVIHPVMSGVLVSHLYTKQEGKKSIQDPDRGGLADRPEDAADVWHTVFGLAGLSLLGHEGLAEVDPVYCMPISVTQGRMGLYPLATQTST